MRSEPGYVYLLINYAMPGLVKIGRTSRAPSDRLDELSSATGVPTPFELVYDVLVSDAALAEQFIHTQLTERGYRLSDNREFFRAPLREVLRLMIHLREAMESTPLSTNAGSTLNTDSTLGHGSDVSRDPDELLLEAALICSRHSQGSTSLLQRRLKLGYGRAATIIDQLHRAGILGAADGSKPRDVLVRAERIEERVKGYTP
jgi:hypothetical protein